jgi:hypothetical protein
MWKRRVQQTCGNIQQREGKQEEERETDVATKGWNKSRRRREIEEGGGVVGRKVVESKSD